MDDRNDPLPHIEFNPGPLPRLNRLPLQPGEQWRECEWCGARIRAKRSDTKYCRSVCRQRAHRARNSHTTTMTMELPWELDFVLRMNAENQGVSRQYLVVAILCELLGIEDSDDDTDSAAM